MRGQGGGWGIVEGRELAAGSRVAFLLVLSLFLFVRLLLLLSFALDSGDLGIVPGAYPIPHTADTWRWLLPNPKLECTALRGLLSFCGRATSRDVTVIVLVEHRVAFFCQFNRFQVALCQFNRFQMAMLGPIVKG